MKKVIRFLTVSLVALVLTGYTYYRITDLTSGKVYYTNGWIAGQNAFTCTMSFHDELSGKSVTLQNTEFETISKAEFQRFVPNPKPYQYTGLDR